MKNCAVAITAVCLLIAAGAAGGVVADNNLFPVVPGTYSSGNPVEFPAAEVEILSMELTGDLGSIFPVAPPGPGDTIFVDAAFDITVEMVHDGNYEVVSLADIDTTISISDDGGGGRTYHIELLAMSLIGGYDDGTSFTLQESPSLSSTGVHTIELLPNDKWQIDSFFDVYFELTVGGGPVAAASGPQRMTLVPEPATLLVMAAAGLPLLLKRKRKSRA